MTVYVDPIQKYPKDFVHPRAQQHGESWAHLFADSVDELHAFAEKLGLKRMYFHNHPGLPHYDITPALREKALKMGAQEKPMRQEVKDRLQKAGGDWNKYYQEK